jgi:D-arabinose 5-phosphate isomerase GutQ
MKVVINKCYGGFGLSSEAMHLYAKKKGITLYPESAFSGLVEIYYTVPADKRTKQLENWHEQPQAVRAANNEAISKESLYCRDFDRNDLALVEVVEELGDKANGMCAKLEVIEIPNDINWEIDEYDGMESVREQHRSWS